MLPNNQNIFQKYPLCFSLCCSQGDDFLISFLWGRTFYTQLSVLYSAMPFTAFLLLHCYTTSPSSGSASFCNSLLLSNVLHKFISDCSLHFPLTTYFTICGSLVFSLFLPACGTFSVSLE